MIKKQILILITSSLLLFNSCGKRRNEAIQIGVLRGPSAISMAFLIEESRSFGVKNVDYRIYSDPMQLRNAILRDEVDMATVPSIMACHLINKGKPLEIAAIPIWGTLHLYGEAANIDSWQDLRGREIFMMARGLTPDIIFKTLLREHGLDPSKDVKLNYTFQTHEDVANASIAGKAPLAVLSEPLVSMVIHKHKTFSRIIDLNKAWQDHYKDSLPLAQTALILNGANNKLNDTFIQQFLDAYASCCMLVKRDPDRTADFVVKHNILADKNIALSSISGCNIHFVRAEEMEDGILNYLNFFYQTDARLTGGAPATSNMIYKSNRSNNDTKTNLD